MTRPTLVECGANRLDDVMAIMAEAFEPRFGEAWTHSQCTGTLIVPGVWMTLALHGDEPAGFSLARVVMDEAELLLLAVRPTYRRRGVGSALLQRFCATANARGARRLLLEMREGNTAAALYKAAGFEQVGRRANYYRGLGSSTLDALTLSCPAGKTSL